MPGAEVSRIYAVLLTLADPRLEVVVPPVVPLIRAGRSLLATSLVIVSSKRLVRMAQDPRNQHP